MGWDGMGWDAWREAAHAFMFVCTCLCPQPKGRFCPHPAFNPNGRSCRHPTSKLVRGLILVSAEMSIFASSCLFECLRAYPGLSLALCFFKASFFKPRGISWPLSMLAC
eukprot:1157333-Pelagomonas_calceolata.AAC.4